MLAHETGQANGIDSVGRRDRAGTDATVVRIAARHDATHAALPLLLPLLDKSLTLTSFSSNCVTGTTRCESGSDATSIASAPARRTAVRNSVSVYQRGKLM
jgi:hypothetical protein